MTKVNGLQSESATHPDHILYRICQKMEQLERYDLWITIVSPLFVTYAQQISVYKSNLSNVLEIPKNPRFDVEF